MNPHDPPATTTPDNALVPLRLDRWEIAGAFGDIGTLLPLAVLVVRVNELNPTVVFGVVGAAYVLSGLYYRIPMSVQPLKSFLALAIGLGLSAPVIGAGALIMGGSLLVLGLTGAAGWLVKVIPKSLVRGIQLGVGLILVQVGTSMAVRLSGPSANSAVWMAPALAAVTGILLLVLARSRRIPAGLMAAAFGLIAGILLTGLPPLRWGPVMPEFRLPSGTLLGQAAVLLVLPQLPLTLTNSVAAVVDVARLYFGPAARRVTPRALTVGLGAGNLAAGFALGMPICHGSGGVTAHWRFGARTGASTIFLGALFLFVAVGLGPVAADLCRVMPEGVLGALMIYVGAAHCALIRDTRGAAEWAVVLATGITGGVTRHNGYGMAAGLVLLAVLWAARRRGRSGA